MRAADASAAHAGVTLCVAVGAAWEATLAHPRVPDPLANAFAEVVRAADVSAAHGTGVALRVAEGAACEAALTVARIATGAPCRSGAPPRRGIKPVRYKVLYARIIANDKS